MNRRGFLRRVASAGAMAVTARRLLGAEAKAAEDLRFSTSTVEFKQLPIERACEVIAGLGFEAVDIWGPHRGCPHLEDAIKRLGPDGTKELLAKHKLAFFACSAYNYEQRVPTYMEFLARAGGKMVIQGAKVGRVPDKALPARMKQLFTTLKPTIELAEKLGVSIAIENHSSSLLCTLDSFKAFVELNPSKHLGIALAPYHLEAIKASVPDAIRIAGKQLLLYYAWQYDKAQTIVQLPGHGPTDFAPHLAALREAGYRDYLNIFMHGELKTEVMSAGLTKAMTYLRECNAKLKG